MRRSGPRNSRLGRPVPPGCPLPIRGGLTCVRMDAFVGHRGPNQKRSAERMDMDQANPQLPPEALQHLDALYNLARWLAHDPTEAEDLVQETYLKAVRAADQFQPGTNLRAWLFQILRNTFYTRYKRKGREPEAMAPEELERAAHPSGAVGAGERLAGSADGAAGLDLTAALNRLPEEYRSVVLMADLEDFTMGEIAAIMGCPVGTVKSRLFRARGILKQLLRDYVR
jgi:RNA polymerase sigma-70 factor (ECF subfamily)